VAVEEHDIMPAIPTIHLNGTSKSALLHALTTAEEALAKTGEALAETAPNGRDYYPQGPDAYGKAADEHDARMAAIGKMRADLTEIVNAIYFK
jgi:hypothetical protein